MPEMSLKMKIKLLFILSILLFPINAFAFTRLSMCTTVGQGMGIAVLKKDQGVPQYDQLLDLEMNGSPAIPSGESPLSIAQLKVLLIGDIQMAYDKDLTDPDKSAAETFNKCIANMLKMHPSK